MDKKNHIFIGNFLYFIFILYGSPQNIPPHLLSLHGKYKDIIIISSSLQCVCFFVNPRPPSFLVLHHHQFTPTIAFPHLLRSSSLLYSRTFFVTIKFVPQSAACKPPQLNSSTPILPFLFLPLFSSLFYSNTLE